MMHQNDKKALAGGKWPKADRVLLNIENHVEGLDENIAKDHANSV
jgi:hypothetical protein